MEHHQEEKNILVGIFNPIQDNPNITISHPGSVNSIKSIVTSKRKWSAIELTTEDLEETNKCISKLWALSVDVFVLPGGEPRKMREALTPTCCRMLAEWRLEKGCGGGGGGLVCICAGTVVACGKGSRGRSLVDGVELFDDNRFASAGLSGNVRLRFISDAVPSAVEDVFACVSTADDENDENQKKKMKLKMMYCNGPLMSTKACAGKKAEQMNNDSNISVWAHYKTDIAAKSEARRVSAEETALNAKIICRQCHNKKKQEQEMLEDKWLCLSCGQLYFKSDKIKSCCGMKKREQEKERKLVQDLVGIMPGKGAVVAIEEEKGELRACCRTVLFGPHPEFSCSSSADVLAEAILWACL